MPKSVGLDLGRDYMSVSQLRRRLKDKMNQDVEVRKKYAEFEAKLKSLM